MKKITLRLAGNIFVFCIIYLFYIPYIIAGEIASRSIESNQICFPDIHIQLNLLENQLSSAIEEYIPIGLIPLNISHNGVWDSKNHCIKWGLFNSHEIIDLSYQLTGINTSAELSGNISIDGNYQLIFGDSKVSINCMPEKEQLPSPVFDPPGGSIVPLNLNLISEVPDAVIRYTLDGSLPNENSTLFSDSIFVQFQSVIRASTFKQDYLPGAPVTASYYEPSKTIILRTLFDSNSCDPGIKLSITANESVHSIAVIENVTNGLYPENISNNGIWNSKTRTIKWGLLNNISSYELSYYLRGLKGHYELSGNASVNGLSVDINGTSSITLNCDIQQAALPSFQPRSGTPFPVDVEIFCDTPDAEIFYTIDNSLPDQNSLVYSSPLSITSSTKIKAKAYKSGMLESPLAVSLYPEPAIEHIKLSRSINSADSCFSSITINIEPIIFTKAFAIEEIIPTGLFPSNISSNGVWAENTHTIQWGLFLSNNSIQLHYNLTGVAGIFLLNGNASFDGNSLSIKGDTSLSINCMPELEMTSNPIFETSGDTILPVDVLITCETHDALIYYTIDGNIPDQNSLLYSERLTIYSKTTIRARAFKSEMRPSDVISMSYVNELNKNPYYITRKIQSLNLCSSSVNIDITPQESFKSYAYEEHLPTGVYPADISENGIWLEKDSIIRWGLFSDNQLKKLSYNINIPDDSIQIRANVSFDGQIYKQETFTINSECGKPLEKINPVTFNPPSGSQIPATISMQCETTDVTIYYTTNGTLPDQKSQLYEKPFNIENASAIRAIAYKNGMEQSNVETAYYKNPPAVTNINISVSNEYSCSPHIKISIDPYDLTSNYAIEAYLDYGLIPLNISHQGKWDDITRTIRYGILQERKEISYDVYGKNGTYQISGMLSINGESTPAHNTLSVNIDCYLTIIQKDSILVVMNEDGIFNAPYISAIGPDIDSIIWNIEENPLHGTVTVSGTGLSPEINYQPDSDWFGTDYFNIMVSDKNASVDSIRVNVNVNSVNDPPIFQLESTEIILNEDFSSPQFLNITRLSTPFGEENQTINYRLSPEKVEFADITIDSSNQKIIITSIPDANGSKAIDIIASDGQMSYTQTFLLNVNAINDPPVFKLRSNSIELKEDFSEPYYLTFISINVPEDEQDQKFKYSIIPESINWADLQLNPDNGILMIRSIPDKNGSGQFKIEANDGNDKYSTYTQSITLTVLPINDPPKFNLNKKQIIVPEDFEHTEEIIFIPSVVPDDEKGQVINYYLEESSQTFAYIQLNIEEKKILIKSKSDINGEQIFHIAANDGHDEYSQAFQLEILPVNDNPRFNLSSYYLESVEDFISPVCVGLTLISQPQDECDQIITFDILPSNADLAKVLFDWPNVLINDLTGKVCFESNTNKFGQSNFVIKADDNQLNNNIFEKSFTLNVKAENDPPLFEISESKIILLEDFSFEKKLTIFPRTIPFGEEIQNVVYSLEPESVNFAHISIHPLTGELLITSIPNLNGSQSFTIKADDRQTINNKAYQSFTLTITKKNDPPEFELSQGILYINEDFNGIKTIDIKPLPVPEDEQNQIVTYTLFPKSINFAVIQINNQTLQIEISTVENTTGKRMITIIASDGQNEAFKDFELIILPVNHPPKAIVDNDLIIDEGSILTLNGYQSYDIDDDELKYSWEQISGKSAIIKNNNESIAYLQVPKIYLVSEDMTFKLTVSDGKVQDSDYINIIIRDVFISGDINDDGMLDMLDLVIMLETVANIEASIDFIFKEYADVNFSGDIDIVDVLYVFKQIVE